MANIKQRGNTFRIRVFVGTDNNGKKIMKSTTFTPPKDVTPKKAEKLAQEYAFEFERQCRGYTQFNDSMRFSELADWYFTNFAPVELKESTIYTYKGQYKKHILPVLGNRHNHAEADTDSAVLQAESNNSTPGLCHYSVHFPKGS